MNSIFFQVNIYINGKILTDIKLRFRCTRRCGPRQLWISEDAIHDTGPFNNNNNNKKNKKK